MKLKAATRNALPKTDFAVPGKRAYPVPDKSHARNALARVANKAPAVKAEVRAKVASKFPSIEQSSSSRQPRSDKGTLKTNHPQSHDAFLKLGAD